MNRSLHTISAVDFPGELRGSLRAAHLDVQRPSARDRLSGQHVSLARNTPVALRALVFSGIDAKLHADFDLESVR